MKRFFKVIKWNAGILIGLFIILWIAIQLPPVQNFIVDKITSSLSRTLHTKVEIGSVKFKFFKSIEIENIYAADTKQDTLLACHKFSASIGLFSLLKQTIHLDNIYIEGLTSKIYRNQSDSTFNYQFILDAFSRDTVVKDTSTSSPWDIGFGDVIIQNTRFSWQDSIDHIYLETSIAELSINVEDFDLISQSIMLNDLAIKKPYVNFETQRTTSIDRSNTINEIVFPFSGWNLSTQNLQIESANIRYWLNNLPVKEAIFEVEHLDFKNLNVALSEFIWDANTFAVVLDELSFKEKSGLTLSSASLDLTMDKEKIAIKDLTIKTPQSEITNTTSLKFSSWNDLSDFLNQVEVQTQFSNTQLAIEDLDFFIPYIPEAYQISKPIFLNGIIRTQSNQVNLEELNLRIGDIIGIESSGSIKNITDPDKFVADLNLKKLAVDYTKLRKELPLLNLPPSADSLGKISLSGIFSGGMKVMNISNLFFNTSANTLLKAHGKINNLNQPKQISYDLKIDSLKTKAQDIAYFSTTTLAPGLYELNEISYNGLLSGNLYDINAKGRLLTAIGQLDTDIKTSFNSDYSNARYDGNIKLDGFNLGQFLGDTATFGIINLKAEINGKGINADSLNTSLDATVTAIGFNHYKYQNIKIKGDVDQLKFIGLVSMKDQNLTFDFQGLVNLNEEIPIFEFDAKLDTLDLAALNLSEQIIRASTMISSNFKGNNIDDFLGAATISQLHLSNEKEHFYTDSLLLRVKENKAKDKELVITSDLLKATFIGDFSLTTLPALLRNYVNDYFPVDEFISPTDKPDSLALDPFKHADLPDQNLVFDIECYQLSDLIQIFTPTVQQLDWLKLTGSFDARMKDLKLSLNIPNLIVAGWNIDSLQWTINGDTKKLNSALSIPQLTDGVMIFRQNKVNHILANNSISTAISINNGLNEPIFGWGAKINPEGEHYQMSFSDTLKINDERWDIPNGHKILFAQSYLNIKDFLINKGRQSILIKTNDIPTDENYTPLSVSFSNFELSEISAFTNLEGFKFDGLLNGSVVLNDISANLHYLADINISQFEVNDTLIGRFDISASQNSSEPIINLSVGLSGRGNQMLAKGTYDIDVGRFDLRTDIEQVPLVLLDPLSNGVIQNSSGFIAGFFDIKGTADQPDIKGELVFKEAATQINYLKTRYRIPDSKIMINSRQIDFGNMQLFDSKNNAATLSGVINHRYFQDIAFDLKFNTDKFRFLNTVVGDNDLFYGTLFLGAQVNIGGTLELPKININARTLQESKINVSAIIEEGDAQQAAYVIFGKPGKISIDSILNDRKLSNNSAPEIDLLLNLNLTPDAELIVVIDPVTGDQLSCQGNANLTVQVFPSGQISVNGIYTVTKGAYQFNYQGLVKRSFALEPNSTLTFVGDPLDTRFSITAVYNTRTSVYPLISNEASLSESAIRQTKERTDVKVLLQMNGDLDRPIINFDLKIPESNAGVSSVINQKLSLLREDEAELNKQVFGLLLLNSFVAEQSVTAGLSTAGENIALSSVSGLISTQLNRLSDRYLKGVGLVFDLESYSSQFEGEAASTTRTNLNVGLTRSVFNERLKIKIGGVVQVDNAESASSSSSLSNIAGDFVLEYQIDKTGNYILRVFQRSDYDSFNDSNASKTGVGINFKKSFGQ